MALNDEQVEALTRAMENAVGEAGFEFMPDDMAEACDCPDGETPYTWAVQLIEEAAGQVAEYLQEKGG